MDLPEQELSQPSRFKHIARILFLLGGFVFFLDLMLYVNAFGTKAEDARMCTLDAISPSRPGLARSTAIKRCLRSNVSIALKDMKHGVAQVMKPHPGACRYVGVWYSWRNGEVHIIDMQGSGKYIAYQLKAPTMPVDSGTWRYENERIRWTHEDAFVSTPDVNRVVDDIRSGFTLIEINKEKSVFRAAGGQSENCRPAK